MVLIGVEKLNKFKCELHSCDVLTGPFGLLCRRKLSTNISL